MVNSTTVVLGVTAFDETPISWNLLTVVDPASIAADGVITNDLVAGTVTFSSASANFTSPDIAGSCIKIFRGGALERYEIVGFTDPPLPTEVLIASDSVIADGAALDWGWARYKAPASTVIFSPPTAWVDVDSLTVTARREVDDRSLELGRDYRVDYDRGVITPITVWRPAADNTTSYTYRLAVLENMTSLQSGVDGTLTFATPDTFSAPTAAFNNSHIGSVIRISNSGLAGATNNGDFIVAAITSSTAVTLTATRRVVSTADPNNGVLTWALLRRGVLATQQSTTVAQSGFWCPDILVDRFQLYNTYGYLIDRYERSSEAYRALIRGIFQLFMLGPTLERFEAAINVVAGLSVVRDNGEIFLGYDSGAEASGADGMLDGTTQEFTAASATFAFTDTTKYIYIASGFNSNKLYKIQRVVNATTLILEDTPVTDGPVDWELTSTAEQTVATSRTTYTFDRNIPLRASATDNATVGTKIFRAFEVLTDVFECTDYVEDPLWWESVQIPENLMPNQSGSRRQSSPQLFENVINPSDEAQIGDPGFYIGADSEGFVPPNSLIRSGIADGVTTGDPMFPYTNDVFFDSATGAFTAADVGNYLNITTGLAAGRYLISTLVSPTRVQIQAFVDVADTVGATWEVLTGTLPKRHKAAFVIIDKVLKHHLFEVRFDASLLTQLSVTLFTDLEELVFVAKPTYTYIVLTPSLLFDEVIFVEETFEEDATLALGGGAGELIMGNENPLLVIGSSWRIGNWFRLIENTAAFAAPAASVPLALGAPGAGYEYYVSKAYITPTDFLSGGAPIQVGGLVETGTAAPAAGAAITVAAGEAYVTLPAGSLVDADIGNSIAITGSGLGNDGTYRIGAVASDTTATIYFPTAVAEAALTWQIVTVGGVQGAVVTDSQGQVTFEDLTGRHLFSVGDEGDRIRRVFVEYLTNQSWPIYEILSDIKVRLAEDARLMPGTVKVAVTGNVMSPVTAGDLIFLPEMGYLDRALADFSTSLQDRYYLEFTSGVNSGLRFYLGTYQAPNEVVALGAPSDTATDDAFLGVVRSPVVVDEISDWEHVRDQIAYEAVGSTHNEIDLTATPVQDAAAVVNYTAYGVQEPVDPTLSVFDATAGDTYYTIGTPDPRQHRGKSRTGRDTDLFESPVEITVT